MFTDRFGLISSLDILRRLRAHGYEESDYIRRAREEAKARMEQGAVEERVVSFRRKRSNR